MQSSAKRVVCEANEGRRALLLRCLRRRGWPIRAVVLISLVILGVPAARAGDPSFDRVLGWNREANAIVVAQWEWPGREGARERPFDFHGRPLEFRVGGLVLHVRCDWSEKAVLLVGVDAPDARFACRWRDTQDGPERATESIGFQGQRLPPGRMTLEPGRHPGDLALAWNGGGRARRLLWIDPFDAEREKVDLRGAWQDGDWVVAIVHREGESTLGIPFDTESVAAFPLVLALDQSDLGRGRWRQWLLPSIPAASITLHRYRTALEAGLLPSEAIVPAMREAEANGRLDLAELFFRRGIARLPAEEASRVKAAVAADAALPRTRKLLARAARRAPAALRPSKD